MSNSSVVTAFRDDLRRNSSNVKNVNKQFYVAKIEKDTSLTDIQKESCFIQLEFIAWEFGLEFASEKTVRELKARIDALKIQMDNVQKEKDEKGAKTATNFQVKKWQKTIKTVKNTARESFQSFSLSKKTDENPDEIMLDNLLKKIAIQAEKVQGEKKQKNELLFNTILNAVNRPLPANLDSFMKYLILLHPGGTTDDLIVLLKQEFRKLSDEELKKIHKRMNTKEMILLFNAFFTQDYIAQNYVDLTDKDDICDDDLTSDPALQDALSIWPMYKHWMIDFTSQITSEKELGGDTVGNKAKVQFIGLAGQMCSEVHNVDECLRDIMKERNLAVKPRAYAKDWPVDSEGRRIKITIPNSMKRLIGESIKMTLQKEHYKSKKQFIKSTSTAKFEAYCFGNMMYSLGVFFNPNSFCDLLLKVDLSEMVSSLKNADKIALGELHKKLQEFDINNLVMLLKNIKYGGLTERNQVYKWLGIKEPAALDERFLVIVEKLYTAADTLMQSVRAELGIEKDYAYNNFAVKSSQGYTGKNEACMKRLLAVYAGALPKKDFSYTLWDYFYSYFHRSQKATIDFKEECERIALEPLELSCGGIPPAPPGTPMNSPTNREEHLREVLAH